MRNSIKKNIFRVLAVACVACLSLALLCSCSGGEQKKDAAQLNREYMSSVNRISAEAAESLADFGTAAAEGDLAAMRLAASDAAQTLQKISELQVPDALAQVHSEYQAGAEDLNKALTDYLDVFARAQNGEATQEDLEAAMADIEALYNSGIQHLSDADAMVAKLAGPAKDGQDGQEDKGALDKLLSTRDSAETDTNADDQQGEPSEDEK